jgi:hypothetical protein
VLTTLLAPEALVFTSARCPIAVEDPILRRILEAGDTSDGFWVAGEATFSARELRELSHFELVCRSVVRETDNDYKANAAACERAALIDAGGHAPIRLVAGFTLSRIQMKPNMVGSIGDWTEEYVIGSAVAEVFKGARLSGLSLGPVTNPKTGLPTKGTSRFAVRTSWRRRLLIVASNVSRAVFQKRMVTFGIWDACRTLPQSC